MRHKVNFKWSLTGLISVFCLSSTGCHFKVRPQAVLLFTHSRRKIFGFLPFPTGISTI